MQPAAAVAEAPDSLLLLHRPPHVSGAASCLVSASCSALSAARRRQALQIVSFRVDKWNTRVITKAFRSRVSKV